MAEAASRVNRQVDDTQDAFTDIRELIPEEHQLEAAPATNYDHRQTSGSMPLRPPMPASAGNPTVTGDSHPEGCNYGTNPAGARDDTTASVDDDEASDANPDDMRARPTLTFNQDTREGQGNEVLTQYQDAMDRIVDNRTPR